MQYKSTGSLEYVIIGHEVITPYDHEAETPAEYGDAFLVNARGDIPESWKDAELDSEPSNPVHKFAGGGHKYFKWSSEAEFRAVEPEQENEDE